MTLLRFYLRTAANNLWRGGQRALVALLCIAFGVMSLVAMMLVSQSMHSTLVMDPRQQLGADLSLGRPAEEFIGSEHLAELEALRQAGAIEHYALAAQASHLTYRTPNSGEAFLSATGIGIDPSAYPPAGVITVGRPAGSSPTELLQAVGDVLVTRDLAEAHGLQVGDALTLAELEIGIPVPARIRGIVSDTPNHVGGKFYYTLATAEKLAGGRPSVNVALANAAKPEAVAAELRESGWSIALATVAAEGDRGTLALIDLLLKGAGMLGLLVGGIGIANTMQVLLGRRRREVAIWKTLGYRQGELQLLFVTEAALLGTLGSLLGAGLGLAISSTLLDLFRRTGSMLYDWRFSPGALAMGLAVGVVTTVTFALWAIMRAASVPPQALLRQEPAATAQPSRAISVGLLIALALPYTAVTGLVMGSLLKGIGLLLFALFGLVSLGGLMAVLAWAATHLLPAPGLPLVRMARNSLKRRGLSPVFAMIALFAGVVSIALGTVFIQNAGREMGERSVPLAYDLVVTAPADQEEAVREAVAAQGAERATYGYQTYVQTISAPECQGCIAPVLIARSEPFDYQLTGAPWGSDPEGVYTHGPFRIPVGSSVEVTLPGGRSRTLRVVGSYHIDWGQGSLPRPMGLLLPVELSGSLAPPDTLQCALDASPGAAGRVSAALGEALPQATVINLHAYVARFTRAYRNLFVLAVAMAGLAFLAGVLLVANSVSLAMLDRRYEIGVLKAVGYSRRHILGALALEYGLMALIPIAAALAGVQAFVALLAVINDVAAGLIVMPAPMALLIGLAGLGLILVTVLGVAWRPTQVSPVVVLNDRC